MYAKNWIKQEKNIPDLLKPISPKQQFFQNPKSKVRLPNPSLTIPLYLMMWGLPFAICLDLGDGIFFVLLLLDIS